MTTQSIGVKIATYVFIIGLRLATEVCRVRPDSPQGGAVQPKVGRRMIGA